MSMVTTDLLGEYVKLPEYGDAGWIRAVFVTRGGGLRVLVQRDNLSKDFRDYPASEMVIPKDTP